MRRTLGELRPELLKAGRGAGLPLGVAEDIAMAAPWISAEAVAAFVDALDRPNGCDRLAELSAQLDRRAAGFDVPAQQPWALWTALCASQDRQPPRAGSLDLPERLWSRLSAHAARTYVPESEASRQRGAGAGDIDND